MAAERLQKILAAAGVGSRRACEQLILDGRVSLNGQVVRTLPVLADPTIDRIQVDGNPVAAQRHVYFILNKPRGVVCTNSDPAGRTRAVDLLGPRRDRVFPVGRLDADSTGLLLLTNDGALAQHLTHPRYGVPKTYHAEIAGRIEESALEQLKAGVWLAEGRTAPAEAEVRYRSKEKSVLEITLREGRNREVRRILARLGHKVRRLKRIGFGPLRLESMPLGAFRPLDKREVALLQRAAQQPARPPKPRKRVRAVQKSEAVQAGSAPGARGADPENASRRGAAAARERGAVGPGSRARAGGESSHEGRGEKSFGRRGQERGAKGERQGRGATGQPRGRGQGKPGEAGGGPRAQPPGGGPKRRIIGG